MKTLDPEKYRENAQTCRRLAEATKQPDQKAGWLMLNAEWQRLAEEVEKVISK